MNGVSMMHVNLENADFTDTYLELVEMSTGNLKNTNFTTARFFGFLQATDAKFTDFNSINPLNTSPNPQPQNLAGNMLPGASKITAGVGLAYSIPIPGGASVTARTDATYASRIYFSEFNDPALSQGAVTRINAQLRYDSESGKWYASLWGKNVTNQNVATSKILTIALWGYPIYGSMAPPATYGVEFGVNF